MTDPDPSPSRDDGDAPVDRAAPAEGAADPQLDPTRSPGFQEPPVDLSDVDLDRDVTLGEADPREFAASDTAPVAEEGVADLVATLSDPDAVARRRAALALADRRPDPRARAALARVARSDPDADVRQFAVEALAAQGGRTAAATARVLTDDPDPWVRAEAVVALDRLDREAHADAIEAALGDDHHAPRRNALVSTFKRRGEAALPTLLGAADDPAERVREWAAHLLGGVDDDRARARLESMAREDDADVVRETAANAREADPERFRRQLGGPTDGASRTAPASEDLNRPPDL